MPLSNSSEPTPDSVAENVNSNGTDSVLLFIIFNDVTYRVECKFVQQLFCVVKCFCQPRIMRKHGFAFKLYAGMFGIILPGMNIKHRRQISLEPFVQPF